MKNLFVAILIIILSAGQLSWAQNVPCNMDMMAMAAQMTAKQNMMDHSDMNHGEMNHSEHMAMMQMMTMDNQDCCGDNCACPQAAFSGIALVESLDEDFNPNLSQRIRLALFSVKEDQPTNPSPPPITT